MDLILLDEVSTLAALVHLFFHSEKGSVTTISGACSNKNN